MIIYFSDRVENIAGKGENACYQHFFLLPQCFKSSFNLHLKNGDLMVDGRINNF